MGRAGPWALGPIVDIAHCIEIVYYTHSLTGHSQRVRRGLSECDGLKPSLAAAIAVLLHVVACILILIYKVDVDFISWPMTITCI